MADTEFNEENLPKNWIELLRAGASLVKPWWDDVNTTPAKAKKKSDALFRLPATAPPVAQAAPAPSPATAPPVAQAAPPHPFNPLAQWTQGSTYDPNEAFRQAAGGVSPAPSVDGAESAPTLPAPVATKTNPALRPRLAVQPWQTTQVGPVPGESGPIGIDHQTGEQVPFPPGTDHATVLSTMANNAAYRETGNPRAGTAQSAAAMLMAQIPQEKQVPAWQQAIDTIGGAAQQAIQSRPAPQVAVPGGATVGLGLKGTQLVMDSLNQMNRQSQQGVEEHNRLAQQAYHEKQQAQAHAEEHKDTLAHMKLAALNQASQQDIENRRLDAEQKHIDAVQKRQDWLDAQPQRTIHADGSVTILDKKTGEVRQIDSENAATHRAIEKRRLALAEAHATHAASGGGGTGGLGSAKDVLDKDGTPIPGLKIITTGPRSGQVMNVGDDGVHRVGTEPKQQSDLDKWYKAYGPAWEKHIEADGTPQEWAEKGHPLPPGYEHLAPAPAAQGGEATPHVASPGPEFVWQNTKRGYGWYNPKTGDFLQ